MTRKLIVNELSDISVLADINGLSLPLCGLQRGGIRLNHVLIQKDVNVGAVVFENPKIPVGAYCGTFNFSDRLGLRKEAVGTRLTIRSVNSPSDAGSVWWTLSA